MRHRNGTPLTQIYGPRTIALRGGTIAFNFLTPDGRIVDERLVDRRAALARLSLRTGCCCNPGAGEAAFGITKQVLRERFGDKQNRSLDEYLVALGFQSAGAIRISPGLVTNVADVSPFLQFSQAFLGTFPIEHDFPPKK